MHARHRLRLFRAATVLVTGAWALWNGIVGLMLFDAAVEYRWTQSWLWFANQFPVQPEVVDGTRLLVLSPVPAAVALAAGTDRGRRWLRPEEWRLGPLLVGWLALLLLLAVLREFARRFSPLACPTVPVWQCTAGGGAVTLVVWTGVFLLLLRRLVRGLAPLRSRDGVTRFVVLCAVWVAVRAVAQAVGLADLSDGVTFPRRPVYDVLHWAAFAGLTTVAWRWTRGQGWSPLVRLVTAAGLAFASGVLVLPDPVVVPFTSTALLLMAAVLHSLWRWARRPV